ncbi:MAG: DUF421 domain-containing protein [Candidatus Pristimantibacillus sp.]
MESVHFGLMTVKLIVGFVALFVIITLTGRTALNQLTPFHFIYVLVLGEFLGAALYEDKIHIFHFLYAIGIWTLLMLIVEFITKRFKSTRALLIGNPSILIRDGVVDRKILSKNKLDSDELLSLLRQNSVFSLREVKYGILEVNGQISLLLDSKYQKPTMQDMSLPEKPVYLSVSLIMNGEILWGNLHDSGLDQQWLYKELASLGYRDEKQIFLADWRQDEGLHVSPM